MKITKCTSLLLALLVLFSNAGLAFNVHYCGGNIAGITSVYGVSEKTDVDSVPKKSCCGEKTTDKKSCCKDKLIKVKEKSDVTFKTFTFQIDAPFVIQNWKPIVFAPISKISQQQTNNYYCDAHAPPFYKLYSQYIFYA